MVSSGKNAVCSRKLRLHTAFIQIYQYFIGMKKLLLTFVLLTAVFATVFGDNVPSEKSYPVTGKVVDADTEEPLAGAMLKVEGTNIVVGTNSKGEFTIHFGANKVYIVHVSCMGYTTRTLRVPSVGHPPLTVRMASTNTSLEEVVVTGSRCEKPLKDVPVITRVISQEEIKTVNPVDLNTLLEYTLPGIQFYYNSMSQTTTLNYQGMDSKSVLFLLDGERMSGEGADHNIDFSRINVDNIERIEVVRGAASTLYDSRAIGGVINLITKKNARPLNVQLNSRYAGSNGENYSMQVGVNRSRFSSQTSFGYRHRDTYWVKDKEGKTIERIAPDGKGLQEKGEPQDIPIYGYKIFDLGQRFHYRFSDHLNAELFGSFYSNIRPTYSGRRYHQRYEDLVVGGKAKWQINENNGFAFSYTFDNYAKKDDYDLVKLVEKVYNNINHSARLYYTGTFGRHTFNAGIEGVHESLRHYMMKDTGMVSTTQFSLCAQEDWRITDNFNVVVGMRGDKGKGYNFHLTPKISALYRPFEHITFRAGYSQGYRIPTLKELYQEFNMAGIIMIYGNKDLKPEYGSQLSASVEYDHGGFNLSLSAYHNRFRNKITYEYISPGQSYNMRYVNADNVKTTGIEATLNYRMQCGLRFTAAYTYINDYNVRNGYNQSWIRPHTAKFNATYKRKFGKTTESVAFNSQWMSSITRYSYDAKANTYTRYVFDPRTICSINLRSELPRGINLGFMIDNLFNYHDKAADSDVQLPLNGISYVLTVGINLSDLFGK